MDLNELNAFIATDEGKAWADGLKKPLLDKRDELLESIRQANGKTAEALRAKADLEKLYGEERQAVEKNVIDGTLARNLKEARVMEPAIPGIIAELKETYGLAVKADGPNRSATGKMKGPDGAEREVGLNDILATWSATDAAKAVTLGGGNVGGGATASATRAAPSLANIKDMSAEEILANLPALTKR